MSGMVLAIAWRNVARNWRRSAITAAAFAVGLTALLFLWGFNDGGHNGMTRNLQDAFVGSLQVHRDGYFRRPRLENHIEDAAPILAALRGAGVERWSQRLSSFVLAAGEETSSGVLLVGMEPEREPAVTGIARRVNQGRFLAADDGLVGLLGAGVARRLEVGLGDTFVVVGQDRYGGLAADRLTLIGILGDAGEDAERGIAVAPLHTVQTILGMEDRVTEVVARIEPGELDAVAVRLRAELGEDALEVLRWSDMFPWFEEGIALDNAFNYFFLGIVLVIVVAGVVNTVLVSMIQRTREFGILMALGTRRVEIGAMVVAESLIVGLMGTAAGTLIGLGGVSYFGWVGIDLSDMAEGFDRFYLDPVIRTEIDTDHLLITILSLFGASVLSSLYPAFRAMRLEPVEAIAHV